MSSNIANQVSYLRTSRNFPEDPKQLVVEVNKSYVDIANSVNSRTMGLFPTGMAAINGEQWFMPSVNNQGMNQPLKHQGLRQVYIFTATGNIPHGLNFKSISMFTKPSGSFTDGTNYYGAIYASNVAIAGQVTFYITPTNIVVLAGVGAPAITQGVITLEWISPV
jgi:hypothetical protein